MTSRRIPALLTRISTRPKASSATLTMASAFFGSVMDNVDAIASPPAFLMASTVCWAEPHVALALQARPDIAHHKARAFLTEQHGNAAPDPTPRPRDDGGLAFDDVSHGKLAPDLVSEFDNHSKFCP